MSRLPSAYIFLAQDSAPHLPAIKDILDDLKAAGRIGDFTFFDKPGTYEPDAGKIFANDLALVVLSNGLVPYQNGIESDLKEIKGTKPNLHLAEILIDNVPYDSSFLLLPTDSIPVTGRPDPAAAWLSVRSKLEELYPAQSKPKRGILKYVIAIVLVLLILFVWLCNRGPEYVAPAELPVGTPVAVFEKIWEATYGGAGDENVTAMIPASDGGILLAGSSDSQPTNGAYDFRVMKIDPDGNLMWDKSFGGNAGEYLTSAIAVPGGFLLGGLTYSGVSGNKTTGIYGECDFWVVKIDPAGNKLWEKIYGGEGTDIVEDMIAVPDGYLIGGYSSSPAGSNKDGGSHSTDFWLVKTDLNGEKVWDKTYGGFGIDVMTDMSLDTKNQRLILAGYSDSGKQEGMKVTDALGAEDYWMVVTDLAGNKVADGVSGGTGSDKVVTSAFTRNYLLGGESNKDFYLTCFDTAGKKLWDATYGGTAEDVLNAIFPVNRGLLLLGSSESGVSGTKTAQAFGKRDGWIVKVDSTGKQLLDESFGGEGIDEFRSITRLKDGTYLLAGNSDSPQQDAGKKAPNLGKSDFWVIRIRLND